MLSIHRWELRPVLWRTGTGSTEQLVDPLRWTEPEWFHNTLTHSPSVCKWLRGHVPLSGAPRFHWSRSRLMPSDILDGFWCKESHRHWVSCFSGSCQFKDVLCLLSINLRLLMSCKSKVCYVYIKLDIETFKTTNIKKRSHMSCKQGDDATNLFNTRQVMIRVSGIRPLETTIMSGHSFYTRSSNMSETLTGQWHRWKVSSPSGTEGIHPIFEVCSLTGPRE